MEAPGKAQEGAFSVTLEEVSAPEANATGPPAEGKDPASLAAAVDAGQMSPAEAVQIVVDHVLATQLPPDAPPALRSQVRALVESSLQNDPLLANLVARLGGGGGR